MVSFQLKMKSVGVCFKFTPGLSKLISQKEAQISFKDANFTLQF